MKSKNALNIYILLDKSGSMSSIWDKSLKGINGYIEELKDLKCNIFLATFCTNHTNGVEYNVVRNCSIDEWEPITSREITPSGGTPLYECGTRLMERMLEDNPNRATLVVMTDGEENSSNHRYTSQSTMKLVKKLQNKDWGVVFLGANFENIMEESNKIGVSSHTTIYVAPTKIDWILSNNLAESTRSYSAGKSALSSYSFSDVTRAKASGGE